MPTASWVDEASVGLAFDDLPNPFANARTLEALPFDVFKVDPDGLHLWAWDARASV